MKHSEIQMFKQFLSDKKISEVFAETYKKNHLMTNPPSLDDYWEWIRAENLANRLVELLDLNPEQEYFHLGIELLDETKDYLLFILKK